MNRTVFALILVGVMVTGCASTNRLKEYGIHGKNVSFLNRTEVEDVRGGVWIDDPDPDVDRPWTGIIAAFLSIIGSVAADSKLDDAIDTQGVSRVLARQIEMVMVDRLAVRSVPPDDAQVDFLMATHVEHIAVGSNAAGVFLTAKVNQQLYSARDSTLVWEEDLSQDVPLRWHPGFVFHPTIAAAGSVVGAIELLAMEEEEIQAAVLYTAEDLGARLGAAIVHAAR
ncbi:MAG: hypothetical protein RBU27_02005 [Bacteroidota bacterium]|jgi:hypothetical protein|nr:hypothetical protein [Bacteroidota bacterium]